MNVPHFVGNRFHHPADLGALAEEDDTVAIRQLHSCATTIFPAWQPNNAPLFADKLWVVLLNKLIGCNKNVALEPKSFLPVLDDASKTGVNIFRDANTILVKLHEWIGLL